MSGTNHQTRFLRDLGTVPNLLSLSRIVLVAFSVVLFLEGYVAVGLSLGLVGGLTDYLDGYIARKTNTSTELGEVIDRLGDLFLEILAFVLLVKLEVTTVYIFMIYIFREIVVLSARQYASNHGGNLKSGIFGKIKTNFLGYGFGLLLVHYALVNGSLDISFLQDQTVRDGMEILGHVGLYGGLVASYVSASQYMRGFLSLYNQPKS
jgi:CDP-diacylglycerol--glycerol-3-phosphate 3-phosphatidyltransferase